MGIFASLGFKIIGSVAVIAAIVLGIMLGIAKTQLSFERRQVEQLRADLADAQTQAAGWKATSKANEAEIIRLSAAIAAAQDAARLAVEALRKERNEARASYQKLRAEIANVASTDDRHLGLVGQRGYAGLLARHQASP